jgi:hypothetical protein
MPASRSKRGTRSTNPPPKSVYKPPRKQSAQHKRRANCNELDKTGEVTPEEALMLDTDPEDSEDETSSEPEAGLQSDVDAIFKTKAKLPPSRVSEKTLEELFDMMKGPYLNIDPEYQREVVWSETRMTALIDSVIEDYYIPPILFSVERVYHPNGTTDLKRTCIDGKQRLTSIKAFMEGSIGCHDAFNKKWYYTEGSKQRRKIMPASIKKEFRSKTFLCYDFLDLSRAQEELLFGRVQQGIQLTTAEKLRATTGKWQELANNFEQDFSKVIRSESS